MRRCIRIIPLLFCVLILAWSLPAAAAGITAAASALTVRAGETAEFSVSLSGNTGLSAWMFELTWDQEALVLADEPDEAAQPGALFRSGTFLAKQTDSGLRVIWFSAEEVSGDGELFRLRLTAQGKSGTYPVTLTCAEKNTLNGREEPVPVTVRDGSVTVQGGQGTSPGQETGSGSGAGTSSGGGSVAGTSSGGGSGAGTSSGSESGAGTSSGSESGAETSSDSESGAEISSDGESGAPGPATPENPFADVQEGAYYYEPVLWAVEKGITSGTAETAFSPDAVCTRAQVVTFLWRTAGSPESAGTSPFTDVSPDDYYAQAVQWAVEKGITTGTSETTFSPGSAVTRAQTAAFLWRMAGSAKASGENPFADVQEGDYYYDAVLWAAAAGVTKGTSETTFSPQGPCTRGQIVTFLYRYSNLTDGEG